MNVKTDPHLWKTGMSAVLFMKSFHCRMEEIKIEELIRLRAADIACIELSALIPLGYGISDLEILNGCEMTVRNISEAGLELWSVHLPFSFGIPENEWDISHFDGGMRKKGLRKLAGLIEKAAGWGAHIAVIHPCGCQAIGKAERRLHLDICRESLYILADKAKASGLQLAVENMPDTVDWPLVGGSLREMEYIVSGNDALAVCLDVNHLFYEKPEEFVKKLGHRIATLHVSDNDGQKDCHMMPGKGVIDWDTFIESLSCTGYPGPFIFELSKDFDNRMTRCIEASDCWKCLLTNYDSYLSKNSLKE